MYKLLIEQARLSLMLGAHQNNYFVCYGVIYGSICYTELDTKKTYILNGRNLICVINHDVIMHQHELTVVNKILTN